MIGSNYYSVPKGARMADIEKLFAVAKDAALAAGEVHIQHFEKNEIIAHKFNEFDLVTNADRKAEERIISIIKGHFPDHEILAEESGAQGGQSSDYLWVIDPIDGTTNYAHRFPHFAVSIGLLYQGRVYMGVIYDAIKNEMFWAAEGAGAYLNADPIQVSKINTVSKSLLSTGFPCDRTDVMEESLRYFKRFLSSAQAVRRPGSAALDLCYVACGRLDGFWELNLAPWDVTAGACIVREAGGMVTNFGTNDFDICVKSIIATNGILHPAIFETIESERTQ